MCGVINFPLSDFWKITPYQFHRFIEGYNKRKEYDHDNMAWAMYNNAALSQMGRKMPPLKKFLYQSIKPKQINEDAIKHRFIMYQKYYEAACQL